MFCSGCGQVVAPNQRVCGNCGRAVPQPVFIGYPWQRVHRHVQTLGILWVIYAVYSTMGWLIALPFLTGFFGGFTHHWGPWGGHTFLFPGLPWFTPLISVVVFARAALALVTGLGLMRRAPWARTLAIVAGFVTLIKPVLGTALAIYTLWVMLPAASDTEYQQIAAP